MNIFEGWKLNDLMREVLALRMENGALRASVHDADNVLREVEAARLQAAAYKDERDEKLRLLTEVSIKYETTRRRLAEERGERENLQEEVQKLRDILYSERQCSKERILTQGGPCGTCKTCLKVAADQARYEVGQMAQFRDELLATFEEFGRHKPTCRDFWHCTCGYDRAEDRIRQALQGTVVPKTLERMQVAEMLVDREYRIHFSPEHGGKLAPDCEVCEILVAHMQVLAK